MGARHVPTTDIWGSLATGLGRPANGVAIQSPTEENEGNEDSGRRISTLAGDWRTHQTSAGFGEALDCFSSVNCPLGNNCVRGNQAPTSRIQTSTPTRHPHTAASTRPQTAR